jgi:hypothetical protein
MLGEAAKKSWCRLDGQSQLQKVSVEPSETPFPLWVSRRMARAEHMFSAIVPIADVCRGNIATNAIAIAVPSMR